MKILSKYMYGGKSTYENGGIPERPRVWHNYKPKPKKKGEGLSAKEMRRLRIISDPAFDEKAKSGDYTPQTTQRRFVEDLKPQTVIDKEKSSKGKETYEDKNKYRKYINQKNRTRKMQDGGLFKKYEEGGTSISTDLIVRQPGESIESYKKRKQEFSNYIAKVAKEIRDGHKYSDQEMVDYANDSNANYDTPADKPVSKEQRSKVNVRLQNMEDGGYLGYQKPEAHQNITLRPSEIPMFSIPETYSDMDNPRKRERREERFRKRYKKKMDKAYEEAAEGRAAELEEMEGMNERQKRRYQRKKAREEKRYSRRQTRNERRGDRKGYGRPDDYLYGTAPGRNLTGGNRHGSFYIDPETGEQMFKTRKFKRKKKPVVESYGSLSTLDAPIYTKGSREDALKGYRGEREGYGIIEERGREKTNRREARFNRRQRRKQQRQSRREKRRERKYT